MELAFVWHSITCTYSLQNLFKLHLELTFFPAHIATQNPTPKEERGKEIMEFFW